MRTPAPTSIEMLERLVAFDTTSRNSNLELIRYIQEYLGEVGLTSTLVPNAEGTKANLFASIGPEVEGGVVLSGHTDVVPVDGQPWDTDPFTVVHKDARLYGRGVTKPLHFALSYDEEVGCIGVRRLIADIVARGVRPAACIVGEPTGMELVVAHKGKKAWRCRVRVCRRRKAC